MSKKTFKKTTKPLSPKPPVKQDDTAVLVREDLDEQQEPLGTATAAGAGSLTAPAPAARAEHPPAPAVVHSKPLAPLAALWPSSIAAPGESQPSHPPSPQAQKPLIVADAPKASPTTVPPSPPPPARSSRPTAPEKAAVGAVPSKPAAPKTADVSFGLLQPNAKQVALCGDFNGWSPSAAPMKRHADGRWEITVALAPGQYQYKFIVDGEWMPDPSAQKNVPNEHGSLNSVIEVLP